MRVYFLIPLFLFLLPIASAEVTINEIMYDDAGSDANKEWVEIYNNGSTDMNFSNGKFYEGGANHNIILKQGSSVIAAGGYAVIAENWSYFLENYAGYNRTLFDSSFDLANTNETIAIKDASGNILDEVSYLSSFGASGNGKTLERNASGWFESTSLGGTPGAANSILSPSNQTGQNTSMNEDDSANQSQNGAPEASQSGPSSAKMEILHAPSSMKFGDFSGMQARFYSGGRSFEKMRFAAYVYSPAWIARDMAREDTILRNAPYNAAAAAEAENIPENTSTDIVLPLFLKCNPEKKYAGGSYTVRVRGYSFAGGSWSEIADADTQISVSGENGLCTSEVVYVNRTIKENCTTPEHSGDEGLEINISAPEIAFPGNNFTTTVLIKNRANSSLDLEIYSYLYEHSTIMSQGWSGEKWGNSRTANAKKIALAPNGSATIELVNMPRENIGAEKYTFKVRIDDLNNVKNSEERVFLVDVKAPPENGDTNVEIKNETGDNKITGMAAAEHSENTELSFLEMLLNRIKKWVGW